MFILEEDKRCLKQKNYKDLEIVVSEYIKENNLVISELDTQSKEEIVSVIEVIFKHIYCSDERLSSIDVLIHRLLEVFNPIPQPILSESIQQYLMFKIKALQQIPQPEQRTPEWYIFRNNRLTASDLWYVANNNTSKIHDILKKKCGIEKQFIPGKAILHGIKFEPAATTIYERRNNVTILEYGCLPHNSIPFFGASPDGICGPDSENVNYIGRMLEIKCPKSRVITGFIPEVYRAQMQGQLEVCDLEYCDFLECDFQIYDTQEDYIKDIYQQSKDTDIQNAENINKTSIGNEKGVIVEIFDTTTKQIRYKYYYGGFNTKEECDKWEEPFIDEIIASDNLEHLGTTYWYLKNLSCVLVQRDRCWFNQHFYKINAFWKRVEHARIHGIPDKVKKGKESIPFDITQFTGTHVKQYNYETILNFSEEENHNNNKQ